MSKNNDLISRSALLKNKTRMTEYDESGCGIHVFVVKEEDIQDAPAVDAVEVVRHGRYGFVGPHIGLTCSPYAEHGTCNVCKERILIDPQHKNYCPNCGANMNAEVQDD